MMFTHICAMIGKDSLALQVASRCLRQSRTPTFSVALSQAWAKNTVPCAAAQRVHHGWLPAGIPWHVLTCSKKPFDH